MRRFLQILQLHLVWHPQPERDDACIEVEELNNEVQETASDAELMIVCYNNLYENVRAGIKIFFDN